MIRQSIVSRLIPGERDFRWRGGDVSRIEALSDAVFALAMTLLVVTLEVPRTYDEMIAAFRLLPVFAVCFAILIMCWYFHFLFHRRYGLEDPVTVAINATLLFVILFYVYPLKFLFTVLYEEWFGGATAIGPAGGTSQPAILVSQMPALMMLYSGGFAGIFLLFALLEIHAFRRRDELQLDERERLINRLTLRSHLISVGFGVTSMLMAAASPRLVPWAGLIYCLIGPAQGLHGHFSGRAVERLRPEG